MLESLFNKVAGLQACNFIKKRLQHSCFSVNIVKFLRTLILKNICKWLLLLCVRLIGQLSQLFQESCHDIFLIFCVKSKYDYWRRVMGLFLEKKSGWPRMEQKKTLKNACICQKSRFPVNWLIMFFWYFAWRQRTISNGKLFNLFLSNNLRNPNTESDGALAQP